VIDFEDDPTYDSSAELGPRVGTKHDTVSIYAIVDREDFGASGEDDAQPPNLLGGEKFEAFPGLDHFQTSIEIYRWHDSLPDEIVPLGQARPPIKPARRSPLTEYAGRTVFRYGS
jgi:hypothetical protein